MTACLDPLRAALDATSSAVDFFFRNDDVGWADPLLVPLLDLFTRSAAPLDLAVIPSALEPAMANQLVRRARSHPSMLGFHTHGLAHVNHEPIGRKCEFGPSRDVTTQRRDLAAAHRRLRALLGDLVQPIFTPPWNRCTAATADALVLVGYRVLSRDAGAAPLALSGLLELPVLLDWVRVVDPAARAQRLAAHVADGMPIGVMLHHASMDQGSRDALEELLAFLQRHPRVRLRTIDSLAVEGRDTPLRSRP